jgi:hypothetical protein
MASIQSSVSAIRIETTHTVARLSTVPSLSGDTMGKSGPVAVAAKMNIIETRKMEAAFDFGFFIQAIMPAPRQTAPEATNTSHGTSINGSHLSITVYLE